MLLHRASPHMLLAIQHLTATQKPPQRGFPKSNNSTSQAASLCASPSRQPPHAACNQALDSNPKASTKGDSPVGNTETCFRRPVHASHDACASPSASRRQPLATEINTWQQHQNPRQQQQIYEVGKTMHVYFSIVPAIHNLPALHVKNGASMFQETTCGKGCCTPMRWEMQWTW